MKLPALIALLAACVASAAEWQWSVPEGEGRAFLWIPPECGEVRAVVVAQHNMLEESVLEHPEFRAAMSRLGVAQLWIVPRVAGGANIEDGAGDRYLELLDKLAERSGYDELAAAPVIPLGHSACATIPWNFAAAQPERTLAVLSVKGDAPQTTLTGNGRPRMDWGGRNIDGIPGVFVIGEYEWLDERVQPGLAFRKRSPKSCLAMLAEPGEGHFDAGDPLVRFLAMFIRKSLEARLGPDGKLRPIDPADGWLVQRWRLREPRTVAPAPAAGYTGDPDDAFWAFDEEMALAIHGHHAEQIGKKPQLLGFVQGGATVPQVDRHEQVKLQFEPESDGVTFRLETTFLPEVGAGSANLARWTGLPPGAPLGHASSQTRVVRITGPFAETGPGRFELRLNRCWSTADPRNNQLWFAARNPGDATHAPAVQQALMTVTPNVGGIAQTIDFPQPADVSADAVEVALEAESDAGLPVRFYVRDGPAEISGNVLKITPIPRRARFPLQVTVVAWQWGDRHVDTAEQVARTFFIRK